MRLSAPFHNKPYCYAGILCVALLFGGGGKATAQREHVFFVKANGCTGRYPTRTQTGFRVRGVHGVVTALHGVVGCRGIDVKTDNGDAVWTRLSIVRVDIERDVAIVSNAVLDSAQAVGLEAASQPVTQDPQAVRVFGHPYGMKTQVDDYIAHPPTQHFIDLIPPTFPAVIALLTSRKSPAVNTNMLELQGSLVPGHSGAPVLLPTYQVVAVANGGLYAGTVGRSWVIPWSDITWSDDLTALTSLNSEDPSVLFSFDERFVPAYPISLSRRDSSGDLLGTGRQMTTTIDLASTGSLSATTEVSATQNDGFCGAVTVTLLDQRNSVLARVRPPAPFCVGSLNGKSLPVSRNETWSASVSDSLAALVASVTIGHSDNILGEIPSVQPGKSGTPTLLSDISPTLSSQTHTYLEGSKHVIAEGALSPDGVLRMSARYENDDALTGYRAAILVELRDSADHVVGVIPFDQVERGAKSPGTAMCTDRSTYTKIPVAEAAMARSITLAVQDQGRDTKLLGLLNTQGFRCDDHPFQGPSK